MVANGGAHKEEWKCCWSRGFSLVDSSDGYEPKGSTPEGYTPKGDLQMKHSWSPTAAPTKKNENVVGVEALASWQFW